MLKILNENLYLDLEQLEKVISVPSSSGETSEYTISLSKYEIYKLLIEVMLDSSDDIDEKLNGKDVNIAFKLAYNTLKYKKILNTL